jgi:hypothetical protein
MTTSMLRATLAAALAPLAALAAADRSDDVRFGLAVGVLTDSTFTLDGAGSPRQEIDANGEPWRLGGGLVHRFAASSASGPIAGFELFLQDAHDHLDQAISGVRYRLHTRAFGVEVLGGYAVALPSQPRLRLEGAVFGGYFLQKQQLSNGANDVPFTGDGWDAGATATLIYSRVDGWELGFQVRWLALYEAEADYGHGSAKVETDGLLVGLTLGHRL